MNKVLDLFLALFNMKDINLSKVLVFQGHWLPECREFYNIGDSNLPIDSLIFIDVDLSA
jgi:hypothetical protein